MSIESLPGDRDQNHFNLLRLIAASAVIVSHAYGLTLGPDALDPLDRAVHIDIGAAAVAAFFAISGYFISLSFERRRSNLAFVLARMTRILPGLLVVSLLCAFVIGPLFTDLPARTYFSERSVWFYTMQNLSIYRIMATDLPGVFAHNPLPNVVNASLWTLYFEVACYVGLFGAGLLGFLRRGRIAWLMLAWLPVYAVAVYGPWPQLLYFGTLSLPFVVGMTVYQYRSTAILKGWLALALCAAVLGVGLAGFRIEELTSLATAYGVLWLGFARAPSLLRFNRLGDFSYGTYIYGFPIEQVLAALMPGIGAVVMIALALPLALLCGALSWFLVEQPALRLRHLRERRVTTPRLRDGSDTNVRPPLVPGG